MDEFTQVVGCHRKAAIRLLRQENQAKAKRKRRRPPQYGVAVVEALRAAWETTDRLCSKRLHPFLPELVRVLRRHGERTITAEVEAQLCRMSPSTIDRLLKPWHRVGGHRPFTTTKPGSLLKNSIPIRTFADWEEDRPGFLEVDLVPHCGESGEGFYLNTFTRSRSYKKNDSCHVEQKHWLVVRRLIGYDRYSSRAALETLNRIYDLLRLYVNLFQPVMN